jgi:hypothetical protein
MIFSENRYPLFGIPHKRAKPMSNIALWQAGLAPAAKKQKPGPCPGFPSPL